MLRLVAQRVLLAVPTLFIVATLTFFLIQLVPGDPAAFLVGQGSTLQEIKIIHHQLGLDKPVMTQYVDWLSKVLHGDLGTSFITQLPVTGALQTAVPATLSLALLATLLAVTVGLTMGMLAAIRGGVFDRIAQVAASLGLGIPNFWLAVVIVYIFALRLPIFPATGYTPITASPSNWFLGLVLPVVALSINNMAQVMFQARSSTIEVLSSDFIRTLQAVGLPRRRIIVKHVLRNAAIPIVTVTGFIFIVSLGGVVVIEAIFNILGVGSLFLTAVRQHDLPIVQGAILYFTIAVVVVNLLVDLAVAWIDPRVRYR